MGRIGSWAPQRGRSAVVAAILALMLGIATAGFVGQAGAEVSGYERKSVTSPVNSNSAKSVSVICTAGKRVVGGGYIVTVAEGDIAAVTVVENRPPDSAQWRVGAREDGDRVGVWSITATAVCVDP